MTEDQDDAGEVVAATVRVALTAAGQLAEQAARRREAALRDAERTSAAQVATLQAQLVAERQSALGSAHDVLRRGHTATVEEFAQVWQQIRSWDDPVAAAARDRLIGRARERFGVDLDGLANDAVFAATPQSRDRDAAAARTVLAGDSAGQREDVQRRAVGADGRVQSHGAALEGVSIDVAEARMLAAQSHPTSPALAAQPPAAVSQAQRRTGKKRWGVELQSPGR